MKPKKIKKTMFKNNFLPFIRVKGNNYEIGKQTGHNFKNQIARAFSESKKFKALKELDENKPERIDRAELLAKEYFPLYMNEIKGIADGSNLDYRNVLIANFSQFPSKDDTEENCSTVIFKRKNDIILAHNEDCESVMGKYSYLLIVELENGTNFFAHSYPGCIPGVSFGFNSHGITYTTNSLPNPVNKIGLPRILFGRFVLEAKTIEEAIQRAQQLSPRSGGVSYNLISRKEKRSVNLETTADEAFLTEIKDKYFHTNHYISERFKDISFPIFKNSHTRYRRGKKLLDKVEKTEKGALQILSDKQVFCNSVKTPSEYLLDTSCTSLFKISDTIKLSIYPHIREKDDFITFSLNDLKSK
ncbi:MAG: C45 family autoproteolytic acyltransferase/hydrolase [Promethearchaeota archaeon]